MLRGVGFHASSRQTEFTDRGLIDTFCFMILSAFVHVFAGLLVLPCSLQGWDNASGLGKMGIFAASFMILGWCLFVSLDEFLRCFLPVGTSVSGLSSPCPCRLWASMAFGYHFFWITLILPANELDPHSDAYHTLICTMCFGGGLHALARLAVPLLSDHASCHSRVPHKVAVLLSLVVSVYSRIALYFPAAIECFKGLHRQVPASANTFGIAAVLTGVFNIAVVMDAVVLSMTRNNSDDINAQRMPQSQARPLKPAVSDEHVAECTRAQRARPRPKSSRRGRAANQSGSTESITDDTGEDELTFGSYLSHEEESIDAENFVNSTESSESSGTPHASTRWPQSLADEKRANPKGPRRNYRNDFRHERIREETDSSKDELRDARRGAQRQRCDQQACQQPPLGDGDGPKSSQRSHADDRDAPPQPADYCALYASSQLNSVGHYVLLGLNKNASADDIKRAFYQLSRRWHPDKNPADKDRTEAVFRSIKEAYECLSDPIKRKRYDKFFAP